MSHINKCLENEILTNKVKNETVCCQVHVIIKWKIILLVVSFNIAQTNQQFTPTPILLLNTSLMHLAHFFLC